MQAGELNAFVQAAWRFAQQQVGPMVGTTGRDGDLTRLAEVLDHAGQAGLMASAQPDSPGFEYGVWGQASKAYGPAASLAILEEIATACAGVAACVHYAGLGAFELAALGSEIRVAAVALFEDSWRPSERAFTSPPEQALRLVEDGVPTLNGEKNLVATAPNPGAYVIYARGAGKWQPVIVSADDPALAVYDAGWRIGLGALSVINIQCRGATAAQPLAAQPSEPANFVVRLLLGHAAIALGNARGALQGAYEYAAQRRQGGQLIIELPAVKLLLGDAHSRVMAGSAQLRSVGEYVADWDAGDRVEHLRRIAAAKLRITIDCCEAVSDCLQIFGGYGYMEEYRLEKRLRDAQALRVIDLKPDDLRSICAAPAMATGAFARLRGEQ